MTTLKYFLIVSVVIIFATTKGLADEFTSYFFTSQDIIFFAYEDGTSLSLTNSDGNPVFIDPCELNKGEHVLVEVDGYKIFKATGSKKISVLCGDEWWRLASGFYAMDAKGRGVSREFYTYVPTRDEPNQKFIVFAYQNNTTVSVQDDTGQFNANFTLQKGGHWENATLSNKYVHVTANKAVSALSCFDNEYFVPSANGRWSGTEFYTYIGKIHNWPQDLAVIAYYDDTSVSIKDSVTQEVIWGGTLGSGQPHVLSYPLNNNISKYFTIISNKTVTVCALQWLSSAEGYRQMAFVPDINGTGIGTDLIGPKTNLNHDDPNYYYGYLYILAHSDDTHIEEYNSVSGLHTDSFTLDAGESVCSNQEAGLWRIKSDKAISVYSGYIDYFDPYFKDNAEFVPLSFNQKLNFFELTKDNNDPNNDCVKPFDPNKQNYLIFDINWSANGYTDTNVFLVDKLPYELDYNWSSYPCDYNDRKKTWNLGNIV